MINYRQTQLAKLRNVEVITDTRLTAEQARQYGAEIVVVAAGASWNGTGMNGFMMAPIAGADHSLDYVLTPEQVMTGKAVGERVLVYDTDGYFTAVGVAERLAEQGKKVIFVTAFEGTVAPFMKFTLEAYRLNRKLRAMGIEIVPQHIVVGIEPTTVTSVDVWEGKPRVDEVDSVVLVTQRDPDDALYHELKADPDGLATAGISGVYRIGDCEAPGIPADAVFSGHRLAREIDSTDPDAWVPFIRERRLVGSTEDDYQLDSFAIAGGDLRRQGPR